MKKKPHQDLWSFLLLNSFALAVALLVAQLLPIPPAANLQFAQLIQ